MTTNLARVHWRMGQTLLPEHFTAQEEALAAEAVAHLRASGPPHHGIASLEWNEHLLATGVLSLRSLTAVFPSGALVDVPGNGRVAPLDLNGAGTTEVTVYLHLLPDDPGRDEDAASTSSHDHVPRRLAALALGLDPDQPQALETIRLGLFRKGPGGAWVLTDAYVPPLLRVGASPYLEHTLSRVLQALEGFESHLLHESARSLASSSLSGLKMCLKGLHRLRRVLTTPRGQVYLHPYLVHEALCDFRVDVCLYADAPLPGASVYDHAELGRVFHEVVESLCQQLSVPGTAPYVTFQRRAGAFRVELPKECRSAREVYVLVQKPSVDRPVALEGLKLAAASRLPLVHKLALQGIPLERVERPAAAHAFGPEVEFHAVRKGEEWEHALREGAVAFYGAPALADASLHLYWRG